MDEIFKLATGNEVVLNRTQYNSSATGRCYHQWVGVYKIIKSSMPVTNEDVGLLKAKGIFGCGQIVNATLFNDEIKFSGVIDSGD